MEFFEKAHLGKSTRKDSKSDEKMKKKLKQMLYGYNHNDNVIIKNAEEKLSLEEDSSSVSGYSDLNLTNSSAEGNLAQEHDSSDHNNLSTSDNNDLHLGDSQNATSDAEEESEQSLNVVSISEYEEDINSLSEGASGSQSKIDDVLKFEESNDDSSFIETSTDIDSNSSESTQSEFDADGQLAAKILSKLNKVEKEKQIKKEKLKVSKEKQTEQKTKPKKRKFVEIEDLSNVQTEKFKGPYAPKPEEKEDETIEELSLDISNISLPEGKQFPGPYRPASEDSKEAISDEMESQHSSIGSTEPSSPFVSVEATGMNNQKFDDILEYTYTFQKQAPQQQSNDLDLFETESVSVADIETEEDVEVGSLIPEVDDTLLENLEEIDQEMAQLDSSTMPLEDSTTLDDTMQSPELSEREDSTDAFDHTCINRAKVFYAKNKTCVFVLKHPAELFIHGKVKVKRLGGTVEILGYNLKDQSCDVYAPTYNYAQRLHTVPNDNNYYGLFGKLTVLGIDVLEAEDIVTSLGEFDSVVSMQPLNNKPMDFVEDNFTVTDMFRKPTRNIESCFKKASEILGCSLYLHPWRSFQENPTWEAVVKCGLQNQSKGIVYGGKGVGKSTFIRYCVNKLLAKGPVLVIDLDPGQCEFTVAGNVSATVVTKPLLGPNYTHLMTPKLMLHIGMINTMDNPRRYAAAVTSLINHCNNNSRLRELPWLVNTMGMTNSQGLKFATLITILTQPTYLLQIDSRNSKKRFDFHLYPQTVKNLFFEDYQQDALFRDINQINLDYGFFLTHPEEFHKSNFSLAPKDERFLNFLAYFGELTRALSTDLLGIVPYEVSLNDVKIGLNVRAFSKAAVGRVINGKVVALCESPPISTGPVFTLDDTPLRCFGIGLVRGVDWERKTLYVVSRTSAPTLVCCDWAPELRGPSLVPAVKPGVAIPYRTAAFYDHRHLSFPPKRRFNPLQLIKMSRTERNP